MKLTERSEMKTAGECRWERRGYRRASQASWWFGQMRRGAAKACAEGTKREGLTHRES